MFKKKKDDYVVVEKNGTIFKYNRKDWIYMNNIGSSFAEKLFWFFAGMAILGVLGQAIVQLVMLYYSS